MHSVSEIVAHMCFWQEWFCDRCDGLGRPIPAHAAEGWPAVAPGSWPHLHERFMAGLSRAVQLEKRGDERIAPVVEIPALADCTVRNALIHIAQHNSHHLGQIILLRQLQALWPPPSGGLTW